MTTREFISTFNEEEYLNNKLGAKSPYYKKPTINLEILNIDKGIILLAQLIKFNAINKVKCIGNLIGL